ncbi:MAG: deoxyribose-phosphate aldolase [Desulfuromonadales bacterium]|nr:deoxyribose-phosphate aldolase [Desulfuromonadales bacterium]NIS41349.1 deoxyribose-phosphate aldolase [Desulfuromonadales bacterium]
MVSLPDPAPLIDLTLLKADTTEAQIRRLCEEAVEYGFASVCIPPAFVTLASDLLYGSEVKTGTVAGFPLGYVPSRVKAFETAEAVGRGAEEVDMVIHVGDALAGRFDAVTRDIREVVEASGDAAVKVIIECCYLDDETKRRAAEAVVAAGADYVKTSTGFGPGGATVEDVRLLAETADDRVGVKAAGGIRDWEFCRKLIEAGATRIGASAGGAIVEGWKRAEFGE